MQWSMIQVDNPALTDKLSGPMDSEPVVSFALCTYV